MLVFMLVFMLVLVLVFAPAFMLVLSSEVRTGGTCEDEEITALWPRWR
jgi:hypothetical protein